MPQCWQQVALFGFRRDSENPEPCCAKAVSKDLAHLGKSFARRRCLQAYAFSPFQRVSLSRSSPEFGARDNLSSHVPEAKWTIGAHEVVRSRSDELVPSRLPATPHRTCPWSSSFRDAAPCKKVKPGAASSQKPMVGTRLLALAASNADLATLEKAANVALNRQHFCVRQVQ